MAKRIFSDFLQEPQNTSETILRLLIHETSKIYEKVTGKKWIDDTQVCTQNEINIFNLFKKEHPEYFTEQNNENMQKNLKRIPD